MDQQRFDIFISYASKDDATHEKRVTRWKNLLDEYIRYKCAKPQIKIFFDKLDMPYGQAWRTSIEQALTNSNIFIPIMTRNYFGSETCKWECECFLDLQRGGNRQAVIPVWLKGSDKKRLPEKLTREKKYREVKLINRLTEFHGLVYQDTNGNDLLGEQHKDPRDSRIVRVISGLAERICGLIGEPSNLPSAGTPMAAPDDFANYTRLGDTLLERASKDQLANVARLLALNIGYYRQRYGDVPQEELLGMVRADSITEDARGLLLHGMQNLVSALAEVMGAAEDGGNEARH